MAAAAPPRQSARVALFLALAGLGLAAAVYLTYIHVNVHTDPSYHSRCAVSSEVNCDSVAQSRYSVFLGLPIALWGLCGYLAMAALALHRPAEERAGLGWPGLLVLVTGAAAAAVAPLAAISKLLIHSVCLVCVASWAVTAALFAFSVAEARRGGGIGRAIRADLSLLGRRRSLLFGGALAVLGVPAVLFAAVPRYWETSVKPGSAALARGADLERIPWIGAEDPVLTIVEFSDYQCPFCQRAERQIRALVDENPDTLRVVHRQFPLDMACNPLMDRPMHPRACALALAAICAGDQGAFWPMNDAIFGAEDKDTFDVEEAARRLGLDAVRLRECMKSAEALARLRRDIEAGTQLGVQATPTFVIDGKPLPGGLPSEEIRRRLAQAQAERAGR